MIEIFPIRKHISLFRDREYACQFRLKNKFSGVWDQLTSVCISCFRLSKQKLTLIKIKAVITSLLIKFMVTVIF